MGDHEKEKSTKAIIQLDFDYFYAQVEEVLDPSIKTKPVGIKQKHIIVTCK
jgi:DNA polymerase iota